MSKKIQYDVAMAELQSMFQELDRDLIHSVLVAHKGKLQSTIDSLLEISRENSAKKGLPPPQRNYNMSKRMDAVESLFSFDPPSSSKEFQFEDSKRSGMTSSQRDYSDEEEEEKGAKAPARKKEAPRRADEEFYDHMMNPAAQKQQLERIKQEDEDRKYAEKLQQMYENEERNEDDENYNGGGDGDEYEYEDADGWDESPKNKKTGKEKKGKEKEKKDDDKNSITQKLTDASKKFLNFFQKKITAGTKTSTNGTTNGKTPGNPKENPLQDKNRDDDNKNSKVYLSYSNTSINTTSTTIQQPKVAGNVNGKAANESPYVEEYFFGS